MTRKLTTKKLLFTGLLSCFWVTPLLADSFQPPISIPAGISPRGVGVGNVYGRGTHSLVVANFGSSTFIGQTTPATLLNPQNSTLQIFSPSPAGLILTQTIQAAPSPRGVFLFDLSGKGRQEILVTGYDANVLQVFSWEKGQFVKTAEETTGKMPVGVTAGLTRRGGTPFAAVANYGSNTLSLFKVEAGKFLQKLDVSVAEGPAQIAIGDMNGDGINEIAAVCLPAHKILILSKAPGSKDDDLSSYSVSKTINLGDGSSPSDLRVGDLNGDGKADLVAADFTKNLIYIFFQNSDGTLSAQFSLSTSGEHPNGLTVADLFGTGEKEIIVANRDSDSIDIFQMKNGQYQLSQTLKVTDEPAASFGPIEIGVIDANGQGKLSLVASHMRSNSLRVLNQTAGGNSSAMVFKSAAGEGAAPFSEKTTFCYPNPSKDGKVKFTFSLLAPSAVNIRIFDVRGEVVWSQNLSPSQTNSGINVLNWEGVNQAGESLASGLYLYSIKVGEKTVTKKVNIIH